MERVAAGAGESALQGSGGVLRFAAWSADELGVVDGALVVAAPSSAHWACASGSYLWLGDAHAALSVPLPYASERATALALAELDDERQTLVVAIAYAAERNVRVFTCHALGTLLTPVALVQLEQPVASVHATADRGRVFVACHVDDGALVWSMSAGALAAGAYADERQQHLSFRCNRYVAAGGAADDDEAAAALASGSPIALVRALADAGPWLVAGTPSGLLVTDVSAARSQTVAALDDIIAVAAADAGVVALRGRAARSVTLLSTTDASAVLLKARDAVSGVVPLGAGCVGLVRAPFTFVDAYRCVDGAFCARLPFATAAQSILHAAQGESTIVLGGENCLLGTSASGGMLCCVVPADSGDEAGEAGGEPDNGASRDMVCWIRADLAAATAEQQASVCPAESALREWRALVEDDAATSGDGDERMARAPGTVVSCAIRRRAAERALRAACGHVGAEARTAVEALRAGDPGALAAAVGALVLHAEFGAALAVMRCCADQVASMDVAAALLGMSQAVIVAAQRARNVCGPHALGALLDELSSASDATAASTDALHTWTASLAEALVAAFDEDGLRIGAHLLRSLTAVDDASSARTGAAAVEVLCARTRALRRCAGAPVLRSQQLLAVLEAWTTVREDCGLGSDLMWSVATRDSTGQRRRELPQSTSELATNMVAGAALIDSALARRIVEQHLVRLQAVSGMDGPALLAHAVLVVRERCVSAMHAELQSQASAAGEPDAAYGATALSGDDDSVLTMQQSLAFLLQRAGDLSLSIETLALVLPLLVHRVAGVDQSLGALARSVARSGAPIAGAQAADGESDALATVRVSIRIIDAYAMLRKYGVVVNLRSVVQVRQAVRHMLARVSDDEVECAARIADAISLADVDRSFTSLSVRQLAMTEAVAHGSAAQCCAAVRAATATAAGTSGASGAPASDGASDELSVARARILNAGLSLACLNARIAHDRAASQARAGQRALSPSRAHARSASWWWLFMAGVLEAVGEPLGGASLVAQDSPAGGAAAPTVSNGCEPLLLNRAELLASSALYDEYGIWMDPLDLGDHAAAQACFERAASVARSDAALAPLLHIGDLLRLSPQAVRTVVVEQCAARGQASRVVSLCDRMWFDDDRSAFAVTQCAFVALLANVSKFEHSAPTFVAMLSAAVVLARKGVAMCDGRRRVAALPANAVSATQTAALLRRLGASTAAGSATTSKAASSQAAGGAAIVSAVGDDAAGGVRSMPLDSWSVQWLVDALQVAQWSCALFQLTDALPSGDAGASAGASGGLFAGMYRDDALTMPFAATAARMRDAWASACRQANAGGCLARFASAAFARGLHESLSVGQAFMLGAQLCMHSKQWDAAASIVDEVSAHALRRSTAIDHDCAVLFLRRIRETTLRKVLGDTVASGSLAQDVKCAAAAAALDALRMRTVHERELFSFAEQHLRDRRWLTVMTAVGIVDPPLPSVNLSRGLELVLSAAPREELLQQYVSDFGFSERDAFAVFVTVLLRVTSCGFPVEWDLALATRAHARLVQLSRESAAALLVQLYPSVSASGSIKRVRFLCAALASAPGAPRFAVRANSVVDSAAFAALDVPGLSRADLLRQVVDDPSAFFAECVTWANRRAVMQLAQQLGDVDTDALWVQLAERALPALGGSGSGDVDGAAAKGSAASAALSAADLLECVTSIRDAAAAITLAVRLLKQDQPGVLPLLQHCMERVETVVQSDRLRWKHELFVLLLRATFREFLPSFDVAMDGVLSGGELAVGDEKRRQLGMEVLRHVYRTWGDGLSRGLVTPASLKPQRQRLHNAFVHVGFARLREVERELFDALLPAASDTSAQFSEDAMLSCCCTCTVNSQLCEALVATAMSDEAGWSARRLFALNVLMMTPVAVKASRAPEVAYQLAAVLFGEQLAHAPHSLSLPPSRVSRSVDLVARTVLHKQQWSVYALRGLLQAACDFPGSIETATLARILQRASEPDAPAADASLLPVALRAWQALVPRSGGAERAALLPVGARLVRAAMARAADDDTGIRRALEAAAPMALGMLGGALDASQREQLERMAFHAHAQ